MTELLESIERLDKDLVDAIRTGKLKMTHADIRYMVDLYYQLQDFRKASANQDRASNEIEEPTRLVSYVFTGLVRYRCALRDQPTGRARFPFGSSPSG